MKLGNVGNGIPRNSNDSKCGEDPPKNVSGSTGVDTELSLEMRLHCVKTGNGSSIAAIDFSNAEPPMQICNALQSMAVQLLCTTSSAYVTSASPLHATYHLVALPSTLFISDEDPFCHTTCVS